MSRSYTFTHALCRAPARSIVDGLRAVDTGQPDLSIFAKDHADYIAVLRETGADVRVLPANEVFPDSVFIEDAALCLQEGAIVTRPGAPSRLGEAADLAPVLKDYYSDIRWIEGPGFLEGGDVLTCETEILVGQSARTDGAGIAALRELVADWGYKVREVQTPPGVLHFKTDCSLMDEETILSTKRLSDSGCFAGYRVLHTAPGEDAAANAIRFNDIVLMPAGFPETAGMLGDAGYTVREVGNAEAAKLDGGMSCLSLRLSPKG